MNSEYERTNLKKIYNLALKTSSGSFSNELKYGSNERL
jgi:hypothetical protein